MWKELSAIIWQWDEAENNELSGELVGFATFDGGDFGDCLKYTLETPEFGRVSFVGGTAFDKMIESAGIVNGDRIRVNYKGQKVISGGRKVNLFRLFRWSDE